MASVEVYNADTKGFIVSVKSDAVPRKGELINISKVTYKVVSVSWAVDQPTGIPSMMVAAVWVIESEKHK